MAGDIMMFLGEFGCGLYLFALNPEGEPAGFGCGLYLEPAGLRNLWNLLWWI